MVSAALQVVSIAFEVVSGLLGGVRCVGCLLERLYVCAWVRACALVVGRKGIKGLVGSGRRKEGGGSERGES